MARTKEQIKQDITNSFMNNEHLATRYGFNLGSAFNAHFSLVSLENILFEVIAWCVYVHEQIIDNHKKEVDSALLNQKSGTLPWYRTKALNFQYGFDLYPESDVFNNGVADELTIQNSKIIKYAAVNESSVESRIVVKIATEIDDELSPITPQQQSSFEAYLNEIRYAGVRISVVNYQPDMLYPNLTIYRDPLLLDANGMSILNGNYPVNDAINEYMKELPFDGEFVVQAFVDKLQQVEGVKIAHVNYLDTAWIDPATQGYGALQRINVKTIPQSGYFKVPDFNMITYVV